MAGQAEGGAVKLRTLKKRAAIRRRRFRIAVRRGAIISVFYPNGTSITNVRVQAAEW